VWGYRKVDVRLPGKGDSNSHGARLDHLIITMIKWIRTSRLSIKNSLSGVGAVLVHRPGKGQTQRRVAPLPPRAVPTGSAGTHKLYIYIHICIYIYIYIYICIYVYVIYIYIHTQTQRRVAPLPPREGPPGASSSSLLLSSLELSDTQVYEP